MSGGRYNHLHDFLERPGERVDDLPAMRDRLTELGYADIAADLQHTLDRLREFSGVAQAVEWFDSGDWQREQVDEAARKYRDNARRS